MEKQIEKKACKNCIQYQMCVDKFRKAKQDGEVLLIEEEAYFADAGDCYFYADKRIYRKQEWISVEERLPAEDVRVLVWLRKDHKTTYTRIDTDRRLNGVWVRWYESVTHWMPLPEPPKGE